MSNVLKNYVFHKLENVIDEFMQNLYEECGIRTGDIDPWQAILFEKAERNLASMICELMEQNCSDDFSDECDSESAISGMSIEALLRGFLKKETEFRLKSWFELPEKQINVDLINDITEKLYSNWDVVNMDMVDKVISDTLAEKNIQ